MNYDKLHRDLTESFIEYQYRLDNPFPELGRSDLDAGKATYMGQIQQAREPERLYMVDRMFRAKVQSMVAGVIRIVQGAEHERT